MAMTEQTPEAEPTETTEPVEPVEPEPEAPRPAAPTRHVIEVDPEDNAQIQRLAAAIGAALGVRVPVDKLQAAARRFVTPKPDEPVAFGAVVEDSAGVVWTRWAVADVIEAWTSENGAQRNFADIDAMYRHCDGWVRE